MVCVIVTFLLEKDVSALEDVLGFPASEGIDGKIRNGSVGIVDVVHHAEIPVAVFLAATKGVNLGGGISPLRHGGGGGGESGRHGSESLTEFPCRYVARHVRGLP